jgi:nucleotide-binding universal stress UspA family protein
VPVLAVQPADGPTPSGIADIRRLVLPLDGSGSAEAAIPTALLLARALRMPIELVAIAEGSAALAPVRERLQDAGLTVSTDIRAGDPLAAIQAASRPGDLLVMSGPGRGGTTPPPLGEVAARVIREGTIPVVLVPAGSSDCGS